jgi:gamma-glutamylcyclotransferase (GGCT)/AIG2-like uncharacterized protein YtfP
MPLIFSYGSLREERVQLSTFGRRLTGWEDHVVGFELSSVTIEDPAIVAALGRTAHANLVAAERPDNRVGGMVFEITDAEMIAVDAYEREFAYERIEATLASGGQAWVYVHTPR